MVTKTSKDALTKRKPPPHAWKKGQSGNPSGRVKFPHELRLAFQAHTEQALEVLVRNMDSNQPLIQIKAAEVILNRGWGPPQAIEPTEEEKPGEMLADFSKLNDKEWEQFKKLNQKVLTQKDEAGNDIVPARDQKVWMKPGH